MQKMSHTKQRVLLPGQLEPVEKRVPKSEEKIYTILVELHPGIGGKVEQFVKYKIICYMQLTLQGA